MIRGVDRTVNQVNEGITVTSISSVLPLGGLRVNVINDGDPRAVVLEKRNQQITHLTVTHKDDIRVSGFDEVDEEIGVVVAFNEVAHQEDITSESGELG